MSGGAAASHQDRSLLRLHPPLVETSWGGGDAVFYGSLTSHDGALKEWGDRLDRLSASPGMATGNQYRSLENAPDIADDIPPFARVLGVPGEHHTRALADNGRFLQAIEEFVTGSRPAPPVERVLATVLFTDVVNSTERVSALGDRRWRDLMDQHDHVVDRELRRFRGCLIRRTGDGLLAIFDSPARAISCASAIQDVLRELDLTVRAGVHTCEVELRGDDIAGVGVHVAARIQAAAPPDQILVSRTVCELVAGSGIEFASAGTHQLKGMSGKWPLYRVSSGVAAQHGDGAKTKERGRRAADHAERARLAVTKAVKSALQRLAAVHPRLAAHLQATVGRGYFYVYTPDPRTPITWSRE
jgi:class 3 adenylate cyclase